MENKTLDEKIVILVGLALERKDVVLLRKLVTIFDKRADFEEQTTELLGSLSLSDKV